MRNGRGRCGNIGKYNLPHFTYKMKTLLIGIIVNSKWDKIFKLLGMMPDM